MSTYLTQSTSPVVETTDINIQSKKKNTRNQYLAWEDEAIRLAKSRRYKSKLDICRAIKRRIDLDEDASFTAEYICCSIKTSASDFKKIIKSSQSTKSKNPDNIFLAYQAK